MDDGAPSLTRRSLGLFLSRSSSIVNWPTLRSSAATFASYSAYDAGRSLFFVQIAAVVLRQPEL
jgi:hypothetical protein